MGFEVNADLAQEQGAAEAWVPSLASGVDQALQVTRDQVDAGIEPFTEHPVRDRVRQPQLRRIAGWHLALAP